MTYVITQSCCNDTSCVDVCPVDCIHPAPDGTGFVGAEMLYIDPDGCIDCGACVDACPVAAIYPEDELPEHLADYAQVNADYFTWIGEIPAPAPNPKPGPGAVDQQSPLRVAVVGAGPAGWFLTDALTQTRRANVEVTVLDRLPTPFGLVRYGVAPDHLSTKEAADYFSSIAAHRKVKARFNIELDRDISHEELLAHHHAVVYATGAGVGRTLGIDGEELPGCIPSAEFVGWYNGHPDHVARAEQHRVVEGLDQPRTVIVGNGNVALDMARLLLIGPESLHASDMAPDAVATLSAGKVEEVVVLGRRGAEHAAFTSPELMALVNHPDIDVIVDPADLASFPDPAAVERSSASFALAQKAALLRRAAEGSGTASRRLVLRFNLTPHRVLGTDRVTALEVVPTGVEGAEPEVLEAGLVLLATGYRSAPVPGVQLDEEMGRFRHGAGRVLDPATEEPVPATYTTGWAKRGPSGVIGTNRECAAETAAALLDDYVSGALPEPGAGSEELDALFTERGVIPVDHKQWKQLDARERADGQAEGRPRLKITDISKQVRISVSG